jgi:hypothetical protein
MRKKLYLLGSIVGVIALGIAIQYGVVTRADITTDSTGAVASTTNPVITNVIATSSSNGMNAIITWTTNELATSQVGYGTVAATTTGYMNYTGIDFASSTNHTVNLNNLLPNTQYHFQVISTNADQFTTRTNDMTFMTQPSPEATAGTATTPIAPVISGVGAVSNTLGTGATISWMTDVPTNAQVLYGLSNGNYTSSTTLTSTYLNSHAIILSGLTPGTIYYFTVQSTNTTGTLGTTSDYSIITDNPATTTTDENLNQRVTTLEQKVAYLLGLVGNGTGGTTSPPVNTSGAHLSPSSASIMSGGSVDFNGRGFGSEETVTISTGGSVVGTAHADGGGNFSTGSMMLSGTGTNTYTFTGATSGIVRTATVTFQ